MIDFLHLGQGPRPDLLEQELKQEQKRREAARRESAESAPEDGGPKSDPEEKREERLEVGHKDVAAMIIALFQVLLPWIAGGIAIYFLVVFLISRI